MLTALTDKVDTDKMKKKKMDNVINREMEVLRKNQT